MNLQEWIDWIRDELDDVVAAPDHLIAHPVYAAHGFVSVVTPGPDTTATVEQLLREAHARSVPSRDDRMEQRP